MQKILYICVHMHQGATFIAILCIHPMTPSLVFNATFEYSLMVGAYCTDGVPSEQSLCFFICYCDVSTVKLKHSEPLNAA